MTALPRDLSSSGVQSGHFGSLISESKSGDIGYQKPAESRSAPPVQKSNVGLSPAAVPPTVATATAPVSASQNQVVRLKTKITKGPHGIGLDLTKAGNGQAQVQRFKEMPAGVQNPAFSCNPAIECGDIIVEVNSVSCASFADLVKAIRGAPEGPLTLTLERKRA